MSLGTSAEYIPALIPNCRQLDRLDVYLTTPQVDTLLLQNQNSLRSLSLRSDMTRLDVVYFARQVLTDRGTEEDKAVVVTAMLGPTLCHD
ncbi:hypothetical protein BGX33_007694 [Mortierella sp. NVP41]|nr:hypothetical protein BGX33_007694 [Mortierella sp. NVP41]